MWQFATRMNNRRVVPSTIIRERVREGIIIKKEEEAGRASRLIKATVHNTAPAAQHIYLYKRAGKKERENDMRRTLSSAAAAVPKGIPPIIIRAGSTPFKLSSSSSSCSPAFYYSERRRRFIPFVVADVFYDVGVNAHK